VPAGGVAEDRSLDEQTFEDLHAEAWLTVAITTNRLLNFSPADSIPRI
jgi:hypothetical protein